MIGPMHLTLGRGASFILTLEVIDRAEFKESPNTMIETKNMSGLYG